MFPSALGAKGGWYEKDNLYYFFNFDLDAFIGGH